MAEQLDTRILPLLPLTSGVVLPGMVVTIPLESPEAKCPESSFLDTFCYE